VGRKRKDLEGERGLKFKGEVEKIRDLLVTSKDPVG